MAGICEEGAFYTEGLKSGAFTLFALQKVLGNFYGFVNALKPLQYVFQVDAKPSDALLPWATPTWV